MGRDAMNFSICNVPETFDIVVPEFFDVYIPSGPVFSCGCRDQSG